MLKNLKSLFIIEEDAKSKTSTEAKAEKPKEAAKPAATTETSKREPGKIRPKFTDILLKAMDQANLDGFDYLEYKKSL